jgi:hypothetical protein
MQLACRADQLLLDAGPVRRFLEVGTTLLALKSYLGERTLIVPQVRTELEVVQNWTGHAALKLILNASPPWPSEVEVPDIAGLEDDIETVRLSLAKPGEPQTKHIGEAATIVCRTAPRDSTSWNGRWRCTEDRKSQRNPVGEQRCDCGRDGRSGPAERVGRLPGL